MSTARTKSSGPNRGMVGGLKPSLPPQKFTERCWFHFSASTGFRSLGTRRWRADNKNQAVRKTTNMTTTKQSVVGKYFPILKSAIARLFAANRQMPAQTKITPQPKPATRAQLDDDVHWCNRHGMFPVPREFLMRGCSDSGRHFSVFQCSDKSCKEFVAVIVNNKHPEKNWILFRGQNFRPRPERRPAPRTPFKPIRAASATA